MNNIFWIKLDSRARGTLNRFEFLKFKSFTWLKIFRSEAPTVYVLKNFAKFTGKHLCQSLFFKKETPTEVLSYKICKIFKNTYFKEHLWRTTSGLFRHNVDCYALDGWTKEFLCLSVSHSLITKIMLYILTYTGKLRFQYITIPANVVLVFLLLTLNIFYIVF